MNQDNLDTLWAAVHKRKARNARITRVINTTLFIGVVATLYTLVLWRYFA